MNITQQTMGFTKDAVDAARDAILNKQTLHKDYTTANNLAPYSLQAPAKNIYPVITPLRNSLPRVDGTAGAQGGGTGLAAHWKVVSAIIGSGVKSMPWVPQGQRSATQNVTTSDQMATYVTLGEEDNATFEAWSAAQGFEDIAATMRLRLLQGVMIKEEVALLGGNKTMLLGTGNTPTVTAVTGAGSIAAATYSVKVVPLTLEGWLAASLSGGVIDVLAITGADGKTYALHGGSGIASSGGTATLSAPGTLTANTAISNGAVAYAWYVGTAGSERLEAITTINSVSLTSLAGTGQLVTALNGSDNSRNDGSSITISATTYVNPPAFDGLMYTVYNANALQGLGGAYIKHMDTGTDGVGTPLTASGAGTIVEIDDMLQSQWDLYRLGVTVIYVASQEAKNIRNKVLQGGAATPLLRLVQDASSPGGFSLTAGGEIAMYFNPFAANGGYTIPVKIHPNLPAGTILGYCEQLPPQYQNNEVPRVAEVRTRRDYYGIDWPLRTRQYEVGVYSEEVFVMYVPFAAGIIDNIGNG